MCVCVCVHASPVYMYYMCVCVCACMTTTTTKRTVIQPQWEKSSFWYSKTSQCHYSKLYNQLLPHSALELEVFIICFDLVLHKFVLVQRELLHVRTRERGPTRYKVKGHYIAISVTFDPTLKVSSHTISHLHYNLQLHGNTLNQKFDRSSLENHAHFF